MWTHRISSVIITILFLIPGIISSSSISQTDDHTSKGRYDFSIIYPTKGATVNGTIKMHGIMGNATSRVVIHVDKTILGFATLDFPHNTWYFYWDTTNFSNGFHLYRIFPTYIHGPDRFYPSYSQVYVINPYPSFIENPIGPQHFPKNVQYRDVRMSYSVPNLTDINMEYAMFIWDFGDGTGNSGRSVTHTYYSDGNYTISLQVINDKCNIRMQQEVEVVDQPSPQRAQEKHEGKIPTSVLSSSVFLLFIFSMCLFIFKDLRRR